MEDCFSPLIVADVFEEGSGVPGISDTTARALLERFGSVEGLLAAGPDEWAGVNGVGPVRAHALAEALLDHGKAGVQAA